MPTKKTYNSHSGNRRSGGGLGHCWRLLSTFSVRLMTGLQVMAGVSLLGCAASVYVNPATVSFVSIVTMAFPFFVAGVVGVGLLALLFTPRRAWISLLALILCSGSIRNYCPVNYPEEPPADSYHVMTWNLGAIKWDDSSRVALKDYLQHADLDLLCLQEICPTRVDTLISALRYRMPYNSRIGSDQKGSGVSLLSRWPVVGADSISISGNNRIQAFYVLMGEADTLIVVNCHFQSYHLDPETRTGYNAIVHQKQTDRDSMERTSHTLLRHIRENSAVRGLQVDTVADFLRSHAGRKILLMGDFNDTPVSYARQTIFEAAPLCDAWRDTGTGIGRTFNRDGIYVHIDHIFCSEQHFRPYKCSIGQTLLSDHYPVDCYIAPINNTK